MNRKRTEFCGYSVKFSPFKDNLLALASSQYYGIAGNGRVSILDISRNLQPVVEFTTRDCCFDVAWAEQSESIIAAATGDGSVKVFDTANPTGDRPVLALSGHTAETYSVDWNFAQKNLLTSASWDRSVRVWDVAKNACMQTILCHKGIVYESKWGVRDPNLIASVGGDGQLIITPINAKSAGGLSIPIGAELLCVDWNKYRDHIVATGSVDRCIRVHDLRNAKIPLHVMDQNLLAVRRVKYSPHEENVLMSCSYDMGVKLWQGGDLAGKYDHHTEFAVGIDFSNFHKGLVASTGWDRQVAVWHARAAATPAPLPRQQQFRQSAT